MFKLVVGDSEILDLLFEYLIFLPQIRLLLHLRLQLNELLLLIARNIRQLLHILRIANKCYLVDAATDYV
jgi:hypothetical protein